ncbi:MAG: AAA family ATPase [Clostridia bacterium]|nr:AAA family ATPase [Clostridia bacterium]
MTRVILISGASGSGKTTFADSLAEHYRSGGFRVAVFSSDAFFRDTLPKMISPADGREYPDWNHPTSADTVRFAETVETAKSSGEYDYVISEGVNVLCYGELLALADVKIFVDASPEMRLYRRIVRNMKLMGLSAEEIGEYYLKCARYREAEFCLPSSSVADMRVDNEWGFDVEKESFKIEKHFN